MKTLFILIASVISNTVISSLLHNTAKPLIRNLVRRCVKYTMKVVSLCLIGCLTFVAGLVMTFDDLGGQLAETGSLYFSPPLAFGLGLLILGAVFVYVGAFSNLLSPWKELEKSDLRHDWETAPGWAQMIETFMSAVQEGSRYREEEARPTEEKHAHKRHRSEEEQAPSSLH